MNIKRTLYKKVIETKWLSKETKAIAHKNLRKSGENLDVEYKTDFYGLEYRGNLSNNVEYNIYRYGAFEKHLLFFLRDTLNNLSTTTPKTVFYDIGANVGQHSLYTSKYACEVHSFEPYDVVSNRLEYHIEINKITNIHLHKVGLSDTEGELDFFAPTGHNQGIGSFDSSTQEKGNVPAGKLKLVNGDTYVKQAAIPPVSLLKIDVEGFEKNAINGLRETLNANRPIIVCEVTYGKPLSFESLEDFQDSLPEDYNLFSFNNRKADGSKAKKRGRKIRYTGEYELIPYRGWKNTGQDDVIACPSEKLKCLSERNFK